MANDAVVIVQISRGGAVDRHWAEEMPPSVVDGRVVVEHLAAEAGALGPPEAGEVILSVLSPEALARDRREIRDVLRRAPDGDEPLVILVEAAEYLREDELAAVQDAAEGAHRRVIVRVLADA
jgi:hypothetical protein